MEFGYFYYSPEATRLGRKSCTTTPSLSPLIKGEQEGVSQQALAVIPYWLVLTKQDTESRPGPRVPRIREDKLSTG